MCGAAWAWPGDATIVRIEHPVPDFARCKQAFDSDPVGREQTRVRRDRSLRNGVVGRPEHLTGRVVQPLPASVGDDRRVGVRVAFLVRERMYVTAALVPD